MAQYDDLTALNGLTKVVYGKGVHQAVPDNVAVFFDLFPFVPNQERLGSKFAESVTMSIEQGVTRATGTPGVITMNNSIASSNQQAIVDGETIVMQAVLSWDAVAKARTPNSAQSFANAMTTVVDNTLLSHRRHQTADLLYGGQALATISSGTASATQTITSATCAPGVWYGSTNMLIDIYDSTLTTKRNASPLSLSSYVVDPGSASRTLTFGTSVTTTTGDQVVFSGTVSGSAVTTAPGLAYIAGTTGSTLFGLSQSTYPVFQAGQFAVGGALSMAILDKASTLPLIRGYTGKLKLLCHPQTFSNLAQEEVARIHLTQGLVRGNATVGYDALTIITSTGAKIEVEGSPWIREGEAYLVPMDKSLKRIGAVDIQLGGPADPQPTWRRIEGQTGYSLPTYSLQALFTPEPWKITKLTGIVNT